ncbi:methyl-accepting chemotaxis protein [Geothrix sp. PMB-07]|uniref:methyl-accepting chemotaxis protein n=1 Tax=Geothrix sp. PMB-07 TaxID=3068640 RepID=UPI00274157FC|nr:methyl-accepting chemotaxis protein [Geothrix sp. PMB-07]WLT30259.1 methyl-accepting chemotaxis protein [Geothrix sp. PMB-07]
MGFFRSKVAGAEAVDFPPPSQGNPPETLNGPLAAFLRIQAGVLEEAVREQGLKLQQAEGLMGEAVRGFGEALQELDVLARDQYELAMELHRVLEVSLEGQTETQSVEAFATTIRGTLDLFVQAMMEIGKSSFQLVDEMEGIRGRSASMSGSLGELAEVATRTHMLALNASIEAAHARKYGAGFSVVAGEVQKLADRSGRISDQISAQVRETEEVLSRASAQASLIASNDFNEIIRSKQLAETMVTAISQSEIRAQALVARMEDIGKAVTAQVGRSIQALQFEDMVRQILQRVGVGSGQLAVLAAKLQALANEVDRGELPLVDLLTQAAVEFEAFGVNAHNSVQAASMDSGDVELF